MSNEKSSKKLSGDGLTPVESIADIPVAMLEFESECSALSKELELVASTDPKLAPVMKVLAGRAGLMLKIASNCRRVAAGA